MFSLRRTGPVLLVIAVGAVLRFYNLQYFHSLDSDEAVYAQAAYALAAGQIPYRDFFYASPPLYLYLNALAVAISPSLESIRTLNVLIGLFTIPVLYQLSLRFYRSPRTAYIAVGLYAIYPYTVYMNKLGTIENTLTLLVTAGLLLFMKSRASSSPWASLLPGLVFGAALMTKYSAVWIMIPIVAILVWRRDVKKAIAFVIGAAVIPALAVVVLVAAGLWDSFWVETVEWQFLRLGQDFGERVWSFFQYATAVFPLLLLSVVPFTKRERNPEERFLGVFILVPLLGHLAGKTLFFHYFVILTPLLCISAARGLEIAVPKVRDAIRSALSGGDGRRSFFIHRQVAFAVFGILLLVPYVTVVNGTYGAPLPGAGAMFDDGSSGTLAGAKFLVAAYVRAVTSASDVIWTSDAGIAFLAHRLIVPAQVDHWRFQGFFEDIWGYTGTTRFRGSIPGYPDGLVTLAQIQQSWETYRPKVIVIVRTVPVDDFIWNGIHNPAMDQAGLAAYIVSNYHLGPIVQGLSSTVNPSNAEIWVRN